MNYGKTSLASQEVSFVQPALSSNGTIGGDSFAVSGTTKYDTGYELWHLFDNDSSTVYASNGLPANIVFYNPIAIKITSLTITNGTTTYIRAFKNWVVYGSNDNNTYTQLTSGTNSTTSTNTSWTINLNANTNYYKYYKIYISSSHGDGIIEASNITITGTYITSALNDIIFPMAHTNTDYSYSLAYFGDAPGNSYAASLSITGISLQENSKATGVYYMTMGY